MASPQMTTEEYILHHAKRYQKLVAHFDGEVAKETLDPRERSKEDGGGEDNANADVVVAARLRPLLEAELASGFPQGVYCRRKTAGSIDAHDLKRPVRGPPALPTLQSFNYQVDRYFDQQAETDEVYEELVKPLVPWAWGGGIGTLFAYGQTGSGKTYTISHVEKLVIQALMGGDGALDGQRKLYMSIFELAGNTAYDLLNSRDKVPVLEDGFGVVHVTGALEHQIKDTAQAASYIEAATSFRQTEKTLKNDASSRSHAICRIRIENPDLPGAEDGLLYLIDLAGSEAARDVAQHGAERMRETREINVSLSVLKDCIRGKAEADSLLGLSAPGKQKKKQPHVPFRQSTLTKVLKHVFDPAGTARCKTVVLACVNPCLLDIGASRNTLRYAEMLRVFVPKTAAPVSDPEVPMTWSNAMLRDWIDNNSGSLSISSELLAPFESGIQLLRLPAPEFDSRCLKSEGVTPEYARAFRSKLEQKHVDSQRPARDTKKAVSFLDRTDLLSSKDPDPKSASLPFTERIRPGMAVQWYPPQSFSPVLPKVKNLAVVLCPVSGLKEIPSSAQHRPEAVQSSTERQFLCAIVLPGGIPNSHTVSLWRQVVVDVEWMTAEVMLEYDAATRYYHLAV